MFKYYYRSQCRAWLQPARVLVCAVLSALGATQMAYAADLTVTVNQQATQADPVLLNGVANAAFVAVFSAPITTGSFTVSDVKTTGSTASGIVIESVTEMAPMDGTTFEIIASASGSGTIVLSTAGDSVVYTPITAKSYSTPTSPYQMATNADAAYVGTYNGGGLYEINATTNTSRLFSNLGGAAASGTVMSRNGSIYVAGYRTSSVDILRFTPPATTMTKLASVAGAISFLNVDSQGNVFTVTSTKIVKVTPAGVVTASWATTPEPMADTMFGIDSQDNMYMKADSGAIWKVKPDGTFTTLNLGVDPIEGRNELFHRYGSDVYFFNLSPIDAKTVITKMDTLGNLSTVFDLSKPHPGIAAITDFEIMPDGRFLITGDAPGATPMFIYDPASNASQTIASPANVNPTRVFGTAVSAAGIFYQNNNSDVSYQVATGSTVVTATDANGNHSLPSISTDNVVTFRTAAEMQLVALAKIAAYAHDNTQSTPTLADYTTAGVTGVTAENLPIVNVFVDASAGTDVDTAPEIQALVDTINGALATIAAAQAKIVAYASDNTNPAPTLADYQTLGVIGVTAGNLTGVNAQVDRLTGPDVDTQQEVQALIDALTAAHARIMAYASDNTNTAPTVADYQTLGVSGVTADSLAAVNMRVDALGDTDVDTVTEVQVLVGVVTAAQAKITAYANDPAQPAPTLADYAAIGVTGVTTGNLTAVNKAVDGLSGPDVDTQPEVQALVGALNAAQARIVAYANSNTNSVPILLDYQTIGVLGLTASNLSAMNAKVDALSGVDVDTPLEVQAVVDVLVKTLDYTLRRSADGRYHVYMRPTLSSANNTSLNGRITLTVPHGTGSGRFVISDLQSAVAGVSWVEGGRTDAPVEKGSADYLSFTLSPNSVTSLHWQAGVEQEVFSFLATNSCMGSVDVMSNSDPFNQLPNSANTSPGNQFTNLGWGSSTTNNYLGNYGSPVDCANALEIQVRGFLQGSFLHTSPSMHDSLRTANLVPANQPYNVAPFNYAGLETRLPALLNVTGDSSIVDWVLLELRDKNAPATRLAAMAGLLRRDGYVMDAQTGSTTLIFPKLATDNYYVVLRHRNHLGVMTKTALPLTSSPALVNFTSPTTETYGNDARTLSGGFAFLWAGDANADNQIIANGPGNDLNEALSKVLMSPGNTQFNVNYLMAGYDSSDFNMNGKTLFAGPDNDVNIVIGNIMLHPKNSSYSGNFIVHGTVP